MRQARVRAYLQEMNLHEQLLLPGLDVRLIEARVCSLVSRLVHRQDVVLQFLSTWTCYEPFRDNRLRALQRQRVTSPSATTCYEPETTGDFGYISTIPVRIATQFELIQNSSKKFRRERSSGWSIFEIVLATTRAKSV